MHKYLRRHEAYIVAAIRGDHGELPWADLSLFHKEQIARMQHERLIHLLVTLFMSLFLLLGTGFTLVHPSLTGASFSAILLLLVAAYVVHYFRLENAVQRWYHLANRLDRLAGRPTSGDEGGEITTEERNENR